MSFFRTGEAMVLGPGEGTQLDVLGDLTTLLVSGKQTNEAFTVLSETSGFRPQLAAVTQQVVVQIDQQQPGPIHKIIV